MTSVRSLGGRPLLFRRVPSESFAEEDDEDNNEVGISAPLEVAAEEDSLGNGLKVEAAKVVEEVVKQVETDHEDQVSSRHMAAEESHAPRKGELDSAADATPQRRIGAVGEHFIFASPELAQRPAVTSSTAASADVCTPEPSRAQAGGCLATPSPVVLPTVRRRQRARLASATPPPPPQSAKTRLFSDDA